MTIPDWLDVGAKVVTGLGTILLAVNAKRLWRYCWSRQTLVAKTFELETRLVEKDALLQNAATSITVASEANRGLQTIIEGFNTRIGANESVTEALTAQVRDMRGELQTTREELRTTRLALSDGIVWIAAVVKNPSAPLPPIPERLRPGVDEHLRLSGAGDS